VTVGLESLLKTSCLQRQNTYRVFKEKYILDLANETCELKLWQSHGDAKSEQNREISGELRGN